jgi:hypothetical protein
MKNWVISPLFLNTRSSSHSVSNKNAIKRPSNPSKVCANDVSLAYFLLKFLCCSRSLFRIFPDIILSEIKFILPIVIQEIDSVTAVEIRHQRFLPVFQNTH